MTLRGSQLTLRCQRRVEFDDCSAAPHEATFEKVLNVATGTAPDHVAVDYVDGVLLVSWPMASSLATAGPGARRPSLRRGTVDLSTHRAELPS